MSFRLIHRIVVPTISQALKSRVIINTKRNLNCYAIDKVKVIRNIYLPPCRRYSEQAKPEEMIVDYDHVKKAISNTNILIVDVREPEEIKEHGKIPNSINIPLENISTVLNVMPNREFEQTFERKKPTEDTEIIFYCMIGKRSGMAQQNALGLGYKNVKNYVGSWTDWSNKMK